MRLCDGQVISDNRTADDPVHQDWVRMIASGMGATSVPPAGDGTGHGPDEAAASPIGDNANQTGDGTRAQTARTEEATL